MLARPVVAGSVFQQDLWLTHTSQSCSRVFEALPCLHHLIKEAKPLKECFFFMSMISKLRFMLSIGGDNGEMLKGYS